MPAGNITDKDEFNRIAGELTRTMERLALAVPDVKIVLDAQFAPFWAGYFGMAEADVVLNMTAINKLAELVAIYKGEATKASAEDFRPFMRPVRGLSSVI